MSQQVKTSFLAFKASGTKFSTNLTFSLLTILIAKDGIQDVTNIAASEKKDVYAALVRRLMADEGDSRSISDGIEVPSGKGVNWMQH